VLTDRIQAGIDAGGGVWLISTQAATRTQQQAEVYAARKLGRSAKGAKPTALDFERRIVDSVDLAQPELSFDMAALDDRILMAQYSWRCVWKVGEAPQVKIF